MLLSPGNGDQITQDLIIDGCFGVPGLLHQLYGGEQG